MTVSSISTTSLQQILASQLQAEQANLGQLDQQLATGKKYTDLTDYAPSDALNLMNLQNSATQKQAYLGVINTVQTRLTGYDNTMTDMESVVSQAQTLAQANPSYSASAASSLATLSQNFLKSITVDLNQQIGGRYIYAGSRYTTEPVTDLTTLTNTPSTTIYTDGQTLPPYDSQYTGVGSTSTAAYAQDSANIDSADSVTYGVSSDNPAFQQIISGLQFLKAAGSTTDSATYQSDVSQASSLLTSGLSALQNVHAAVANNINTLTAETTTQKNAINDLTNQVDNISQVDLTQVSTEINLLQTQLQASYSATGSIEKLSIVQYL